MKRQIVNKQVGDRDRLKDIPSHVGEVHQGQSNQVMQHHHGGILPPLVYVQLQVDTREVVTKLYQVETENVRWNRLSEVVICKGND